MTEFAEHKMRRKIFYIVLLLGIANISWIYWTRNIQYNDKYIILRRESYMIKDVSLRPLPMACESPPFLVIIVTSYVANVELRNAHRRTMPEEDLKKINATRVFLLAQIPDKEKFITQLAIDVESKTFGDILQGTFVESYRNLTYKHLMGLKWASTTCPEASFILKIDDDTLYDLERTYTFLKSFEYSEGLLMGYIVNNFKPRRNEENRWYVTWHEYPRLRYPTFVSGWYYITTPEVAAALCNESIYHPYFWIDDIFVTGILAEALGIKLSELPDSAWLDSYMNCDYVVGQNNFTMEIKFRCNP